MAKSSKHLSSFVSGSWDGEIRYWDLVSKQCLFTTYAHERFVKGISFDYTGNFIYSCGDEMEINVYGINKVLFTLIKAISAFRSKQAVIPTTKLMSQTILQSMDCSYDANQFVTGGQVV